MCVHAQCSKKERGQTDHKIDSSYYNNTANPTRSMNNIFVGVAAFVSLFLFKYYILGSESAPSQARVDEDVGP